MNENIKLVSSNNNPEPKQANERASCGDRIGNLLNVCISAADRRYLCFIGTPVATYMMSTVNELLKKIEEIEPDYAKQKREEFNYTILNGIAKEEGCIVHT